jgi:hypothetical protein
MRVRRLFAGELYALEHERAQVHLGSCARCQATARELRQEGEALRRDLPLPAFTAGVARNLAAAKPHTPWRWVAAAGFAALVALGILWVRAADAGGHARASAAQVFVDDAQGMRPLSPSDRVATGSKLRLWLHPGEHAFATAVLLAGGTATPIFAGAAHEGPLPQVFSWDGNEPAARLLVVLSDRPLEVSRLRGPADAPAGSEVAEIPLHR